jgi:ribose-phosphate pyrophosphokinase
MKLTPAFKITISDGKKDSTLQYEVSKFSGGELNVRLHQTFQMYGALLITGTVSSADNIMELLLLKDACDRIYNWNKTALGLAYVPYARQDRVCNEGEALSIKVFSNLINSMNFDAVLTYDNHSDVASALINNCSNVTVTEILASTFEAGQIFDIPELLVSPDAGANKKVFELSKATGIEMIRADKTRCTATGEITGTVVFVEDLTGQHVMIVDDICDGGRTFIELAKVLKAKNAEKVTLYITHGIFSQGVDVLFENGIDTVITTDSFYKGSDERVQVISIQ